MSPELRQRLQALEQTAEAAAITVAALRQQITALVSEAEHSEIAAKSSEAEPPAPQFYGGFGEAPLKVEKTYDADVAPKQARRRP
jgi:hypothetical protein